MDVSEDMAKLLPRAPLQQGASRDMGYKRSNTTFVVRKGPDHAAPFFDAHEKCKQFSTCRGQLVEPALQ